MYRKTQALIVLATVVFSFGVYMLPPTPLWTCPIDQARLVEFTPDGQHVMVAEFDKDDVQTFRINFYSVLNGTIEKTTACQLRAGRFPTLLHYPTHPAVVTVHSHASDNSDVTRYESFDTQTGQRLFEACGRIKPNKGSRRDFGILADGHFCFAGPSTTEETTAFTLHSLVDGSTLSFEPEPIAESEVMMAPVQIIQQRGQNKFMVNWRPQPFNHTIANEVRTYEFPSGNELMRQTFPNRSNAWDLTTWDGDTLEANDTERTTDAKNTVTTIRQAYSFNMAAAKLTGLPIRRESSRWANLDSLVDAFHRKKVVHDWFAIERSSSYEWHLRPLPRLFPPPDTSQRTLELVDTKTNSTFFRLRVGLAYYVVSDDGSRVASIPPLPHVVNSQWPHLNDYELQMYATHSPARWPYILFAMLPGLIALYYVRRRSLTRMTAGTESQSEAAINHPRPSPEQ